jgi:hypothetical protein
MRLAMLSELGATSATAVFNFRIACSLTDANYIKAHALLFNN